MKTSCGARPIDRQRPGAMTRSGAVLAVLSVLSVLLVASSGAATTETKPALSILPADVLNYTKTIVDIPMRDGVRLHTMILRPKSLTGSQPILLERTPYNAEGFIGRVRSTNLAAALGGKYDTILESGYVLVIQDVRGKYGSEGSYELTRPPRGPLNMTATDHSTDAWDTIEWLVKNVPDNNGRVGMLGVSYDGWTTLMALVEPHPALKAAVPINPMADAWVGDDWFHRGAFRAYALDYIFDQSATRANTDLFVWPGYDEYSTAIQAVSAGARARAMGMDALPAWRSITQHPAYDMFWQEQAVDRILARRTLTVPTLLVHGLFDQEDIYAAPAVYRALSANPKSRANLHFAIGPWFHGQAFRGDGSSGGPIRWDGDTGLQFRRKVMQPFLDGLLKDGAPASDTPSVIAYETGSNRWETLPSWPVSCAQSCAARSRPLYLLPGGALGFAAAVTGAPATYISDPAKPVPYVPRPVRPPYQDLERWRTWLLSDQRHASARPDVLVFQTPPLDQALRVSGVPVVNLTVKTTGTDGDFVVKLIDVYPSEVAAQPELGGYELMISADIIRGRYRQDPAHPVPFVPGKPTLVRFTLPDANHVFLPGHRLMVQIQSSWFPLYDRNPQTFVPNIFFAKAADYRSASITVSTSGAGGSYLDLPVAP